MINALFICGKARKRSTTAADITAGWDGFQADFAGLSKDADEQLSIEQIEWADVIFVMERRQKSRLTTLVGTTLKGKRIICLNIPDNYEYMQKELIDLLTPKLMSHLRVNLI
ncbi:low molecular weight protein tyrosine phosphatase family protein [Profundibacter sp.]